jgi:hypothetical protein
MILNVKNLSCELGLPFRNWLTKRIKNKETMEAIVLLLHRVFRYIRFVLILERKTDNGKVVKMMMHKELALISQATENLSLTIK